MFTLRPRFEHELRAMAAQWGTRRELPLLAAIATNEGIERKLRVLIFRWEKGDAAARQCARELREALDRCSDSILSCALSRGSECINVQAPRRVAIDQKKMRVAQQTKKPNPAVAVYVREAIENEDRRNPLRDSQLCSLVKEKLGVEIATRQMTKIRGKHFEEYRKRGRRL